MGLQISSKLSIVAFSTISWVIFLSSISKILSNNNGLVDLLWFLHGGPYRCPEFAGGQKDVDNATIAKEGDAPEEEEENSKHISDLWQIMVSSKYIM